MKENNEREETKIRHTISAEETFTLAKDVYDIRSVIKKIYANRAVISRRLNIVSLIFGIVSTLIYIAYAVFSGVGGKLSSGFGITCIVLVSAYAAVAVTLIAVALCSPNIKTKNIGKYGKTLKIFRYISRILSLAIAIAALVIGVTAGDRGAVAIAVDTVMIILSIIGIAFQTVPLVFGGLGGVARWLLSPVKMKVKFSSVAIEWYQLVATDAGTSASVKKVSRGYLDEIGESLDKWLIPALGKKYVGSISAGDVFSAVNAAEEELRPVTEGVVKNVFAYACECGYISENPCKDIALAGSINIEEKQKKGIKSALAGAGRKAVRSVFNSLINPSGDD